ncbi:TonB-dependent receptor domain-containing protein [Pseudosulfitobacter koreensis]|uniref:TonB-dependent receptor n=1 Tax=Pseudosulfitobacter koreensis TaxID=2968472 RepID=A0ABT1YYB3_9RHOB|nr:TonB-dependent receptor [Pseudosulfitobacter koreense]MCR8825831.1 TonB-dependent receptor [Pseudosulfitobacter koreense]
MTFRFNRSTRSTRAHLYASTAALITIGAASGAFAQDAEDSYLGTIVLGEGKRAVQTDTAVPVTVVDREEIEDRQAGTVAELIDTVPGVTLVNGTTAAGSGINIRGYGANSTYGTDGKVLVQIDGATKGSEELYRIGSQLYTDPFLYREIEVLRGSVGSFEYGSGVFGGVVRLETIDASDMTRGEVGFVGRQTLEFSTNGDGLASSTTLAWQPDTQFEVLFNYTRRTLGVRTDGDGNPINPDAGDIDDPSGLLKAKYTFGAGNDQFVEFSYSKTQQEQFDVPYDQFGTTAFGNVDRYIENEVATLRYNYNPADRAWLNVTAELLYSDELVESEAIAAPNPLLDADNRYRTTTLRVKNEALFVTGTVDHTLRTGIEFATRDRTDATAGSAPGGTKDSVAVYAVDEMRIGDRWTITPALRYESQKITQDPINGNASYDKDALMGGVSVLYAFDSGWSVFGSASYTENLTIIDDLDDPVYIGQSEKGESFEIGVAYDAVDVFRSGDSLALKVNYYNDHLTDLTTYVGRPAINTVEGVDREGIELEAAYAMANGYYLDANAHVSKGTATLATGARTDWVQNPQDNIRLTLGRKFSDELDLSWELEAAKRYDEGGAVSPGYGVHNLRATYVPQQGVLEGTTMRFGVENLFDQTYQPRLSTRNATGRTFKVTLSTTF